MNGRNGLALECQSVLQAVCDIKFLGQEATKSRLESIVNFRGSGLFGLWPDLLSENKGHTECPQLFNPFSNHHKQNCSQLHKESLIELSSAKTPLKLAVVWIKFLFTKQEVWARPSPRLLSEQKGERFHVWGLRSCREHTFKYFIKEPYN
jgi:hypothetical protein